MADVPLREYIEQIVSEKERRLELRMDASDRALALQADEYERRLGDLNHEQARLASDRERYLTKEKFEDWQRTVDASIAKSEGKSLGLSLAWAVFISAAGLLGGFVLTALGFWLGGR